MPEYAVNKQEMAKVLGTSVPTLNRLLDAHGDNFPVLVKGRSGQDWAFDVAEVVAFLKRHEDAQKAAGKMQSDLMRQYRLPEIDADIPDGATPKTLLAYAKLRAIERQQAIEASFLVEAAPLRSLLTKLLDEFMTEMEVARRRAMAAHNIPEAAIETVESRVLLVCQRVRAKLSPLLDEPSGPLGVEQRLL